MRRRYVNTLGALTACGAFLLGSLATVQMAAAAADRGLQPRTAACCFRSTGECQDLAAKECRAQGGQSGGRGTACGENGFECFQKPCCLPDDTCAMMTEEACTAAQGDSKFGRSCGSVDCTAPPRGAQACCIDNVCSDLTRSECTELEGDPQGFGTVCTEDFECQTSGITQACCIDGVCSDLARADCTAASGDPQGFGSACTPDFECATNERTVACCTNGLCSDVTRADCDAGGGTSQGFGTVCDKTIDCTGGEPAGEVCCLADGTCDATARPFGCRRNGGTMTPADSCDPNPCSP